MRLITLFIFIIISVATTAQKDTTKPAMTGQQPKDPADTLAPYQKYTGIPTFSIQVPDSTWFFNTDLVKKKPVLILYFSPDCGHCQLELEHIIGKMNELKKLQIVMITSRSFQDMSDFCVRYKTNKFPTITIGRDPAYNITRFYKVEFTPFSALYNKKGKLVKVYRTGIDMEELVKLVN